MSLIKGDSVNWEVVNFMHVFAYLEVRNKWFNLHSVAFLMP